IYGYGLAREEATILYSPIQGSVGLSLILVPIALILVVASQVPTGYIKRAVQHPMLLGVILWAISHLANNGDWASVLMFGSLLVWSVLNIISCYRRGGRPAEASLAGDIIAVIVGLILTYAFVRFLHEYLFGVGIV
ncbi:MAG: NnrU family protein, partial [Pseudomonadota bacterium]